MKYGKTEYYITVALAFIVLMGVVFALGSGDIAGHCSVKGIELTDVSPNKCWYEDIEAEFCPIPKDIECSFDVQNAAGIIIKSVMSQW